MSTSRNPANPAKQPYSEECGKRGGKYYCFALQLHFKGYLMGHGSCDLSERVYDFKRVLRVLKG